jgi:hypothetical protein
MSAVSDVSALRVEDPAFLITSTIDRCPKVMMVRELFKNALEAAEHAAGGGKVEFYIAPGFAAPKLAIWNNGPGMDEQELRTMTNLAASIGKEKGLDKNFGMGAKVASLPSNRLGIRYRSCKSGMVHETLLCQRDGVYGRLKRVDQEGNELGDVVDVTGSVLAEDPLLLDEDWTEVVLLGNRAEQDTVLDPYDGNPPQRTFWLANYLYQRFYRVPEGVEVRLYEGTHSRKEGSRRFETIPARAAKGVFARSETVTLANGMKIHYIYDEAFNSTSHNRSISGSIASAVSTCAIIFRDEMYAVLTGRAWTIEAPIYGVPFGAKHISVHIELPDDAAVRPEGYRQFLRYIDGEQAQVEAAHFAAEVLDRRPEWLVDLIHSLAPNSADSNDEIRNKLQELLNKLRVRTTSPQLNHTGDLPIGAGTSGGSGHSGKQRGGQPGTGARRPTDLAVVNSGAQMARMARNLERAPTLIPLDDKSDIEERGIKGRAARYYATTGELFINMTYPAVDAMQEQLEKEYAQAPEPEVMQLMVRALTRNSAIQRVGLAVVFALAKRINKHWDDEAMGKALEPESLSIAADNYFDSLQDARRSLGKRLNIRRVDAGIADEELEVA